MASSRIKILIVAAALGVLCYLSLGKKNVDAHFQTLPGHIENFTAINIDGGKTTYEEQKGKATLIALSASWCPACMAEIPILKRFHNEYSNLGFKILMVNEDDNVKIAARFKKKQSIPWTMIHWNYNLMNILGNPGVLPVTYLVNEQDSIIQINSGIFDEDDMRSSIKKLLK